jgi:hypothetical protein
MNARTLTHPIIAATRLVLLGFAALLPASMLAENWITLELRAPGPFAGEGLDSLSGSWGTGTYLGTFEYDEVTRAASLLGLSADAADPDFQAQVGTFGFVANVDHASLQQALANGGVLGLNFQPRLGTVPTQLFLLPGERDCHAFGLMQTNTSGAPIAHPLSITGYLPPSSGAYLRGSATYDPARPFWVVDYTARERGPTGETHLGLAT